MNKIQSISHPSELETSMLIIDFEQNWDDENINSLTEMLLAKLNVSKTIETIVGADRQDVRFEFANSILQLHFEVNSNSCWLEPELGNDPNGATAIELAHKSLLL
ncbi:DUF3630 family protein [Thalassotalea maritima]|uniref:DUF3630 family protein n=1 Tax=Thalassotalea maritima TaxID=3242416 RepID=UPI0035275B9C